MAPIIAPFAQAANLFLHVWAKVALKCAWRSEATLYLHVRGLHAHEPKHQVDLTPMADFVFQHVPDDPAQ